jgi:hypothetical protein
MKKRLLKPPENNGEIFFLPDRKKISGIVDKGGKIGTCHQPYFFNPGVSLKYLFLLDLPASDKEILFLDIDRVNLKVKVPFQDKRISSIDFVTTELVLSDYLMPEPDIWSCFFVSIENRLKSFSAVKQKEILANFFKFKDIALKYTGKKYLKELLVESFLEFYNLKRKYLFFSDLCREEKFKDFFKSIYHRHSEFIQIFNESLEIYKKEYRFRFKNFPYPKLLPDELPFWQIKEGKRVRLFRKDVHIDNLGQLIIFPRAVTLTLFLRLYRFDIFIHGVGGANYEWVQDRIIEKFFKQKVPPFLVISGTFLLDGVLERNFPYFFFNADKIKKYYEKNYS